MGAGHERRRGGLETATQRVGACVVVWHLVEGFLRREVRRLGLDSIERRQVVFRTKFGDKTICQNHAFCDEGSAHHVAIDGDECITIGIGIVFELEFGQIDVDSPAIVAIFCTEIADFLNFPQFILRRIVAFFEHRFGRFIGEFVL